MIRCVAIDDEPKALEIIENHAARTSFLDLEGVFLDPFKAIEYVNAHGIELVFLDINMPAIDGLRVVDHFSPKPLIIFTTAYSAYAVQSYEVEALDFLLKPFDYARFFKAVSKARSRVESKLSDVTGILFVNTGNQKQRIILDELCYIESEGNYVNYATDDAKFLVRSSIKEALKALPQNQFVQIHRSYIVSLKHIEKIEDHFVFIGKKHFPVGATYRAQFNLKIDALRR